MVPPLRPQPDDSRSGARAAFSLAVDPWHSVGSRRRAGDSGGYRRVDWRARVVQLGEGQSFRFSAHHCGGLCDHRPGLWGANCDCARNDEPRPLGILDYCRTDSAATWRIAAWRARRRCDNPRRHRSGTGAPAFIRSRNCCRCGHRHLRDSRADRCRHQGILYAAGRVELARFLRTQRAFRF
jgi:hypothetical protein